MGIPKKVKKRNEKEGKAKIKEKKRKEKTSRCMGLGAFPRGAHSPEWFPARTGLEGHGIQSGLERGFWRPQRFRIFLFPPRPIWSPTAVFRTRAGNPPFLRCTQPVIFGPILCSVVAKKRNGDVARSWTGSFIKSPMNNCWTFFWTLTCQRRCYKNLRIKNELDWNKFIK